MQQAGASFARCVLFVAISADYAMLLQPFWLPGDMSVVLIM
jgi:hypothetical protein